MAGREPPPVVFRTDLESSNGYDDPSPRGMAQAETKETPSDHHETATCRAPCRCGTLGLDSELVYNEDVGATEPGPASGRYGIEFANYYAPKPWLVSMRT